MRASMSVRLLTAIAVIIVLSLGSSFLVPVALGLLLAAVLRPVVAWLRHARVPPPLGAAIAVVLSVVVIVVAAILLEPPVRTMTRDVPRTLVKARGRLEALGVRIPGGVGASASNTPSTDGRPDSTAAPQSNREPQSGSSEVGQSIVRAFGITLGALFALIEILLLAFFILAAGDGWVEKLRQSSTSAAQCDRALDTVREIRRVVLRYLLVNVLINASQAILVALIVWALGYAGPIVWGMLTFIAEFVPYFGGAVMVGLLFLTGLAAGQGFGHAVLAPAAYLIISTLQNNLVSPAAYGRGLRLNPTAILVGVMFWGLVWGVAGVFLAVPLLAIIRVIAERNDSLTPVVAFLAD
jgi:predicted PurR-regulated permease PerM